MKRNPDIENELTELSSVVTRIGNGNVFQTPPGFFEALPEIVMNRLRIEEAATDDLSALEEIERLSPLLASLKDPSPFTVSDNYFNALPGAITGQLGEQLVTREAPVIALHKRNGKTWLRYAAAAMITGLIATGSLLLFNQRQGNNGVNTNTPNGDMASVAADLPAIPDQDLTDYLSSVPETPEWTSEDSYFQLDDGGFFAMDDATIKNMLKDIAYDALQNYEEELTGSRSL